MGFVADGFFFLDFSLGLQGEFADERVDFAAALFLFLFELFGHGFTFSDLSINNF